jgi:SAM-dependent methyltransferase
VTSALQHWQDQLATWAIPPEILSAVRESPWALPAQVFARRTDRYLAEPVGASYARATEALGTPGTVLDIGAGAGAASLPLADRTTALTAVDTSEEMLGELTARAARLGVPAATVAGRWPDVADEVPPADLVVCHHVFYNVPDLAEFALALHRHARRRVVVELTQSHPLSVLNPLWLRLHGLRRPTGPTAADAVAVLREAGLRPRRETWRRAVGSEYGSFDELVDATMRRLCLPAERRAEAAAALRDLGVDPAHPMDLGSAGRELVTIWWEPNGSPRRVPRWSPGAATRSAGDSDLNLQ